MITSKSRWITIKIARNIISNLFKHGRQFKCLSGVPEDAVLVGIQYDATRQYMLLTYSHQDFPEVSEGEYLQEKEPILCHVPSIYQYMIHEEPKDL